MTIASGSSGNCIFAQLCGTRILIDAGVSARRICSALQGVGADAASIDALLVTHEHIDHIRAIPVLSKKCPAAIYAPVRSASYIASNGGEVCAHPPIWRRGIGNVEVTSFPTPHDSEGSCGYILRSESRSLGICTDLGHMTDDIMQAMCGCDDIILESNHDPDMLRCGGYPASLKARIRSDYGHLSNQQCAAAAVVFAEEGARSITLAHLSRENNTPRLAFQTTESALEAKRCKTALGIAPPDEPFMILRPRQI